MPNAKVYSLANEAVGDVELSDKVFGAPVNQHLVWEAVNHYLAKGRAGTASTKTRSEVAGSGRKLWKQKGTGRARVGDIRTPKWRGGGTVHGPKPRSFDYAFPKKKRRGALRCVLSDKLSNGQLKIVENWQLETHKTKNFKGILAQLGQEKRTLVVDDRDNEKLLWASRNLPEVKFVAPSALNVHDLLKYENLVISKDAVMAVQEVLAK
jgi:large subunit ribosomal protein L4